jgi:hypothetical protein
LAQRLGELPHPPPGRPTTVTKRGPGGRTPRLDPPHQPTELPDRVLQQVGVGREVNVGLHHGGVDPQLAGAQQLVGGQLAKQRTVEPLDHLRAGTVDQLDQGGRVRHRPLQPDPAKPAPADRVADLPAQGLVAELVAVFQVQQPQQRGDRDRRAAQPGGKQRPPRRDEAFVVEVGVNLGELGRQASKLRWQQSFPVGRWRTGNAKHRELPKRSEAANGSSCHDRAVASRILPSHRLCTTHVLQGQVVPGFRSS